MDIFLLTIATIFVGLLLGAAIVGAFIAAFFIGLIALLCSIGLLSISFLVGLYNRSLSSGFKTVVALILPMVGMLTGAIGALVSQYFFVPHLSTTFLLFIGLLAGGAGGFILGLLSFQLLRSALSLLAKKVAG